MSTGSLLIALTGLTLWAGAFFAIGRSYQRRYTRRIAVQFLGRNSKRNGLKAVK